MVNPITLGFSALTKRIFAGRSKPQEGMQPDARKFVGMKVDVTDQALHAVAMLLVATDDIKVFRNADGREIHLRADLKDSQEGK